MNILHATAKIVIAPLIAFLSFAGYAVPVKAPTISTTLGDFNPTGGGTYHLSTAIGTTDTSIILTSFKEPISNTLYTMTYLNTSIAYATLDPQQASLAEFISFTGITQNVDGTATLTGVTRGLGRSYPYTASSVYRTSHTANSALILSNSPNFYQEYAVKRNSETITGAWTFSGTTTNASSTIASTTISTVHVRAGDAIFNASSTFSVPVNVPYDTASSSAVSGGYLAATSFAGTVNASLVQKGIAQEATPAQISAFTQSGSTAADLFVNPFQLQYSSLASTTASSTKYAAAANLSTTTKMLPGQTAIVMASFDLGETFVGLYAKPSNNSTTTLQAMAQCNIAGTAGEVCPAAMIGSVTSTTTDTWQFYVGTTINSIYAGADGGTFTILKFATSTFAK